MYYSHCSTKQNLCPDQGKGYETARIEAEKLQLSDNVYYLIGELNSKNNSGMAIENFMKAMVLARTQADRDLIARQLYSL